MSLTNPQTFLDLVQRSLQECQVDNVSVITTINQDGQAQDFCDWVNESWKEVQSKYPDCGFLLVSPGVSFATVAGQAIYTPTQAGVTAGVVGQWKRDTFRNYLTSAGQSSEMFMDFVEYDEWRDGYQFGALRTAQVRPYVFTIRPGDFALGLQTPLDGYTITGDYFRAPTVFDEDADLCDLPAQFMLLPVWRTAMYYAAAEGDASLYTTSERKYNLLMSRLERTRMKEVRGPGALA